LLRIWDKWRELSTWRKFMLVFLVGLLFAVVIPALSYAYYARDISDKDRLINRKNTGVVLLDRSGKEFYSYNNGRSQEKLTPLSKISDTAEQALIAAEDQNFYEHDGFSLRSTVAAALANIRGGDLTRYGGSTLSQQLVKNSLFGNDNSFFRKYQELFLSIAIERQYSKDEILEMYLNSVYFGEGAFGISAAAQTYFNKPASELNAKESALLMGLLPAPSAYSPVSGDVDSANKKQAQVLQRMVDNEFITQTEADKADEAPLGIDFQPPKNENEAYHFALEVIDRLEEEYGEEEVLRSGYVVETSLDIDMQREAEAAVRDQIERLTYASASNGAALAIDPANGDVLVMVGSYDFEDENFGAVNMTTTPRQPGSSFKPIYYSEALARRVVTPATFITDEPTTFDGGYEPENYDFRYRGEIRVRDALSTSLNIPAVKVLDELGIKRAATAAERMGLSTIDGSNDYGLSFALGTEEVQLLDMTNAYAAFANGGQQFEPALIKSIDNKFGRTIFVNSDNGKQVVDEGAAFLISSILSDEAARAPTFGYRFSVGRPMAVKTGTTQDSRDAWTMTYTPNLALGVWVGNNDNSKMQGVGGSSAAGPINVQLMRSYLQDVSVADFEQPSGVESVQVCSGQFKVASGQVPGSYTEFFIRGTRPSGTCAAPRQPEPEPEPEPTEEPEQPAEPEPTEPEEPIDPDPDDPGDGEVDPGDPTTPTPPPGGN